MRNKRRRQVPLSLRAAMPTRACPGMPTWYAQAMKTNAFGAVGRSAWCASLSLASVFTFLCVSACTHSFGDSLGEAYMQRFRAIEDELALVDMHDWAGVYERGNGLSCNMTLAMSPRGQYVMRTYGCLGLSAVEWGVVRVKDRTTIALSAEACYGDSAGHPGSVVLVSHEGHRYALEPSQVEEFWSVVSPGKRHGEDMGQFFVLASGG